MIPLEIIQNLSTEEEQIEYLYTLSEREVIILYLNQNTSQEIKDVIRKYLSKQNKNLLNQLSE
jgi:hypothetical protein